MTQSDQTGGKKTAPLTKILEKIKELASLPGTKEGDEGFHAPSVTILELLRLVVETTITRFTEIRTNLQYLKAQVDDLKRRVFTKEQALIETFFENCRKAGLEEALFGKWDGSSGQLRCAKPGIFTPDQFAVLAGVHAGHLRADALDELLPDSGKPLAVTMKQLVAAQGLKGVEGCMESMVTLMNLRSQTVTTATREAPQQVQSREDQPGLEEAQQEIPATPTVTERPTDGSAESVAARLIAEMQHQNAQGTA